MNKKTIIIMSVFIFLFTILSIITFIMAKNTKDINHDDAEKTNSQIEYIDYQIIKLLNEFDNYSSNHFTQVDIINWDQLEQEVEILYASWNSIIVDFSNLQIDNNALTDFGKKLDNIMINIQNKNINQTLVTISDLYGLLTKFTESYHVDTILKNDIITKNYLIKSYSLLYTDNWTLISENVHNAAKTFYANINMVEISENQKFNLNKIYVAINELKNATSNQNKDLFYIKYKIVMENFS